MSCFTCPRKENHAKKSKKLVQLPPKSYVPRLTGPDTKPEILFILPEPGFHDFWAKQPLQSPAGFKFQQLCKRLGHAPGSNPIIYRTRCLKDKSETTKQKSSAHQHCLDYTNQELEKYKHLPKVFIGMESTEGILSQEDRKRYFNIPFMWGGQLAIVIQKVSVTLGSTPYWYPFVETVMERFFRKIEGEPLSSWPTSITAPGDEMIAALEGLGPDVGWDIETIGTNPLECPITCVGVSDGSVAVSLPWHSYITEKQGPVKGYKEYGVTGQKCYELMKKVLESDRILYTQNGNYDLLGMAQEGIKSRNDFDTILAHTVLYPQIAHDLETIAIHMVDIPFRWKTVFKPGKKDVKGTAYWKEVNQTALRVYNSRDAWATVMAGKELWQKLRPNRIEGPMPNPRKP